MTNKKTEEPPVKKKNSGTLSKVLLLIIFLIIAVVYFILQSNPSVIQNIYTQEGTNLVQEALESHYSVGPEPPVQVSGVESALEDAEIVEELNNDQVEEKFKVEQGVENPNVGDQREASEDLVTSIKKEESEDNVVDNEEVVDPYEEIAEKESRAFNSSALKNKFNDYRIFISNADKLVEKYKSNENYEAELKVFQEKIHPPYINEIVKLLEDYQNIRKESNVSIDENSDQLFHKFLTKFMKVKKLDSSGAGSVKVKENIDERLGILNNYIYSESLQDSLVK